METKLDYKPNYTERNNAIDDEIDTSGLNNVGLITSQRSSMLSRKTRNENRRIANFKNHKNKSSNIANRSISSIENIFSLSNDDTFKSEGLSKIKNRLANDEFGTIDINDSDLSYLSKWQTSLVDENQFRDNSMSYDKDILNQRSDPTLNQVNSEFSLAKLFYPSENQKEEERPFTDIEVIKKMDFGQSGDMEK